MKKYRETTNVFIINNKNEILCVDAKTFVAFPGGGIDPGEDPIKAITRECEEELGFVNLKSKLIDSACYDYYPEWGNYSEKNRQRYKEFKGEQVFLAVAKYDKNIKQVKPIDPLPNKPKWYKIKDVIQKIKKYGYKHENEYPIKLAQMLVLQMLLLKI